MDRESIRAKLLELQDEKYRAFQCGLVPSMPPEKCIGVRIPNIRTLAKEIYRSGEYADFFADLPHYYYDEYNLHGLIISEIKDYDACIGALAAFLPYVDNWATCDTISPKAFKKNTERLIVQIREWISSEHTYTVRFGLEMLMSHYLDELFKPEYLELAASVHSDEYYVKMMAAWFFATALAKQYDAALPYITGRRLDKWVHNKTIQKACESFRVTDERKRYLRTLK